MRNDHRQSDGVHFVLQESSGYMKPSLHFLAVAHTLFSFCCIIGYYCLKVWLSLGKQLVDITLVRCMLMFMS